MAGAPEPSLPTKVVSYGLVVALGVVVGGVTGFGGYLKAMSSRRGRTLEQRYDLGGSLVYVIPGAIFGGLLVGIGLAKDRPRQRPDRA